MSEPRRRLDVVATQFHPAYVVWELTLRCDHACRHCGSRAIHARPDELTTIEALNVVKQLAAKGTRDIVLIGGEAYLHEGFFAIARALADAGINVSVTSGGRAIDAELAERMQAAGVAQVSISIDGLEGHHDQLRARPGSFRQALAAIAHVRAAGMEPHSNCQINRLNRADLEALYEILKAAGVKSWQVQITVPLGRAADRPQLILQPWDLLELVPRIAALKRRAFLDGILILPGNNLGYFGPEEALLRSQTPAGTDHFQGCQAGKFVAGIESHGDVKGCPSLQSAAYVGGNLRDRSFSAIWDAASELAFARERPIDELWGYCSECAYAETCRGGCSFTAHAVFGRRGNNPYCYHRARRFAREGIRERLVPATPAHGLPFDHGTFAIRVESLDAPDPREQSESKLVRIGRKPIA